MSVILENEKCIPPFLIKLWYMVEDPGTNDLICWNKDGVSFIIRNQAKFSQEMLPLKYKHNNMTSFIRQLNMYGFHKVPNIDDGILKSDRDAIQFSHPCFKRGGKYLLEYIKRKPKPHRTNPTENPNEKPEEIPETTAKVQEDVREMRHRLKSIDSNYLIMKQENERFRREINVLRQKHSKHKQILLQFLIIMVQPKPNKTELKKFIQMLINDTPEKVILSKSSTFEPDEASVPESPQSDEEFLDEIPVSMVQRHDKNVPSISPMHIKRSQSSLGMASQSSDWSSQNTQDFLNSMSDTTDSSNSIEEIHVIQQSKYECGPEVVYHVSEIPEAPTSQFSMVDDNSIVTPTVDEQMVHTHQFSKQNYNVQSKKNKSLSQRAKLVKRRDLPQQDSVEMMSLKRKHSRKSDDQITPQQIDSDKQTTTTLSRIQEPTQQNLSQQQYFTRKSSRNEYDVTSDNPTVNSRTNSKKKKIIWIKVQNEDDSSLQPDVQIKSEPIEFQNV